MVLQHLQVPQLEVWQVLLSCAGTRWRQRRPKYFFKGLENDTPTLKVCKTKMVSFIKDFFSDFGSLMSHLKLPGRFFVFFIGIWKLHISCCWLWSGVSSVWIVGLDDVKWGFEPSCYDLVAAGVIFWGVFRFLYGVDLGTDEVHVVMLSIFSSVVIYVPNVVSIRACLTGQELQKE